jgi:8-oxo-dGTP pyrophosphatase MutT (NUDIX family)
MDQAQPELPPVIEAAGVIARSPQGRVLMVRQTDNGLWTFPGGKLKEGETAEQAAWRETFEETGRRLGDVGRFLMCRTKDDGQGPVSFSTYLCDVDAPFVPTLNDEHSAFAWVLSEELLAENRTEPAVIADSANAEPENPPMLNNEGEDGLDAPAFSCQSVAFTLQRTGTAQPFRRRFQPVFDPILAALSAAHWSAGPVLAEQ